MNFNPLKDKENIWAGTTWSGTRRQQDGSTKKLDIHKVQDFSMRGNIWKYANQIHNTDKIATQHPAIFPTELAADHIKSWTDKKSIIFDPFLGSGSTLIACEQTDRICYGVELDPRYVDIAVKRWEAYTNQHAKRIQAKGMNT